ncbi:putative phosphoribosylformylglycinamidine synthase, chloroplastic/mitochondrial [Tetrabaena socialis]|uniref:Putative phosphoribosylformylglycinamidine synthase, chloroplastic/mitochondrial n=1 Tax=Tetrabaena socialis TaxID=47790 RepID=A0A2J7ZPD6_9CHLO|nr:putative phosphoribosylformylglycinamidine synthase, chloroplastic/mitochondrial [Tetrabaena socialis]|eukprot:PNH02126.1 putative phosphoribosylformylglycinamidine synthase, chloroplastic/mitochondrial [Tetrabaena socialis]
MDDTLFNIVKTPWKVNPNNSVVAFKDNSSAIRGFDVTPLLPSHPGSPSPLTPQARDWDLLLTAETHNFPCAVAPFPGAETGAGGRMRDTHATGTGSMMGAGTAGYCVGNLRLDGYTLPHENPSFAYPDNLAPPQQILIDASNGASDYGNKFGEPLIAGYCRTYGQRTPNGERREWLKPIMFSGGVGQIDHRHLEKNPPEVGMLVIKIGGPAYRIGLGGGAASSLASGSNKAELDFNAVQRGDAEYSQKLWRVVRSCVELGDKNPIVQVRQRGVAAVSIHDQGAGGNCNVVKEIIYPLGAEIDVRAVKVGDETLSVLEIWGAEYQENDALLIKAESRQLLQSICDRERCFMQASQRPGRWEGHGRASISARGVIGTIDGSGRVTLVDKNAPPGTPPAVDLDLEKVLGSMPDKTFHFTRGADALAPLALPAGVSAMDALHRVLRLPSVCSKRFLTNKVDRHVTGLVVQQQCVGPLQLPISDVAVYAQSHQNHTGLATSIGEQPIKGLIEEPPRGFRGVNGVRIEQSPAVLLKGMEGTVVGVWCAHGEGKCLFPDEQVKSDVLGKNLAPIKYVDADANATEVYPANPNGSPLGIAALCSENGRHLAMMPHPERCFLTWQLPYVPSSLGLEPKGPAPWIKLFQNAREWAESNRAAK